ncbi:unnamed protein product [Danaus chrysippus]|uniref:(African queen) hypothetical protein n=1 Tax=Danaus chrysippus TaxID=151541 RepID=A0A8J2QHS7_9NEOP|nr:unnamed protein product [Danaus chrysippus]
MSRGPLYVFRQLRAEPVLPPAYVIRPVHTASRTKPPPLVTTHIPDEVTSCYLRGGRPTATRLLHTRHKDTVHRPREAHTQHSAVGYRSGPAPSASNKHRNSAEAPNFGRANPREGS